MEQFKLKVSYQNGTSKTLELMPPLIYHPGKRMYILQDATGVDYWFNAEDGTFDGTGMSLA
jgi:hypothetical protein